MSAGHRHTQKLSASERDELLDEALANPKLKARLAKPYKLIHGFDIALLGSSSIGGRNVYLDRHLRVAKLPYGVLPIDGRRFDVKPALIRHERFEQAAEDELGWPYWLAHEVATRFEHRLVEAKGIDPKDYEAALKPFIKADSVENLRKRPLDLDMRPLLAPPRSTKIIEKTWLLNNAQKLSHAHVVYQDVAASKTRRCSACAMFIEQKYGGPACVLVKDSIKPSGVCRKFVAGKLGE